MTDTQISYYHKMKERNRLFRISLDNKVKGLITFYIGSWSEKYVRDNPWEVMNDEPETGTVCFVDHLLVPNKEKENPRYSFTIWNMLKNYIHKNYPKVRLIRWNRLNKQGESNAHYYFFTK